LLIHGHSEDRIDLKRWLERENLADAIVMAQEFTAGQTLPEKFEELASAADAAIALATPTIWQLSDLRAILMASNITSTTHLFWTWLRMCANF
jgi:hypothetical protein